MRRNITRREISAAQEKGGTGKGWHRRGAAQKRGGTEEGRCYSQDVLGVVATQLKT